MKSLRLVYPRPVVLALSIAIVWYGVLWLHSQGKLIYTDEVGFAQDMTHIAQGQWTGLAIPHPPLYIWLAGMAERTFGFGLPAIRSVGAASFVATLLLVPLTCYAFFKENVQRASLVAIAIYAIHPLALQGSLLLDIDNTIFTPALPLFLTALALQERFSRARGITLVALSYALMLTFKEDGRYTQVTRNAEVQAVLARCYTEHTVGSYLVYLRSAAPCGASAAR